LGRLQSKRRTFSNEKFYFVIVINFVYKYGILITLVALVKQKS
jgi:hypothetical protein